ncbi:MAG: Hsp70 family protein, partial [Ilumatobacteraceae bacterium]
MAYQMGIDLGTTFSSVAIAQGDRIELLGLGTRSSSVPSVVLVLPDGEILVGEAAEAAASQEPTRVAREFKRRLGDPTPLFLGGAPYSAEALTGILLRNLYERAIARMGEPPTHVVITHPAVYSSYKLDLLRDAARQAGLGHAVLLAEPSAAAIEYAATAHVDAGDVIGMYDFGGGTFDAALVRRTASGFELLGEAQGLERLGGVDFDQAVLEYVRDRLPDGTELDTSDPATLSALSRLRAECRGAKELLSEATSTVVPVLLPGLSTSVPITRAQFESMIRPRLGAPLTALRRAVETAGLRLEDVTRIVLVGGSSRIPIVRSELERALGRSVSVDADPEAFVARGAARFASGLAAPAARAPSWAPTASPPPPPPPPLSSSPTPPTPLTPPGPVSTAAPVATQPVGAFASTARAAPDRSRRPWLIGGAVAAVIAAIVIGVVAFAGDDGPTSATTTERGGVTTPASDVPTPAPTTLATTTTVVATTTQTTGAPTITTPLAAAASTTTVAPVTAPTTTPAPTTPAAAPATTTAIGVGAGETPPPMPAAIEGFRQDGAVVQDTVRAFDGGT